MYYDINGNEIKVLYDINGNVIFGNEDVTPSNDYEYTILLARDSWANEYGADENVIPLIIHTDQHQYLNSTNKKTFDYLSKAIKTDELSAFVGLGDVCGAVYTESTLNNMVSCLSSIPKSKQINIAGNHDVWAKKLEGSSYAYSIIDETTMAKLHSDYMNNTSYGENYQYDTHGNGYLIDKQRGVKYCIFATWYYDDTETEERQPYYKHRLTSDVAEFMIDMLSSVDDYDIVILSHIQPYMNSHEWSYPSVDGKELTVESRAHTGTGCLGYDVALEQLISDRKAKTSGTITDSYGNVHTYDFSKCTSDILCCLSGHSHEDRYVSVGGVPSVVFDAYRYDLNPLYMVNIDRTNRRLNIWKFDTGSNIYNYQVPFTN